jgi:hypothetical protein
LLACALAAWLIAQHRAQQDDASSDTPTVTATSTHHAGGGQPTSAPATVATTTTPASSSSTQSATSAPTTATTTTDGDSGGTTIPDSFGGNWRGRAIQENGQVKFWTAELSLEAGGGGTFTVKELGCSGPVTVKSVTDNTLDTTLTLDSTINSDPNQACAPSGTIQLTLPLGGKVADFTWEDASNPSNTAHGLLKRS